MLLTMMSYPRERTPFLHKGTQLCGSAVDGFDLFGREELGTAQPIKPRVKRKRMQGLLEDNTQ